MAKKRKRAGYLKGDSYAKWRGRKLKAVKEAEAAKQQSHREVDRLRQRKEAAERELYHAMRLNYLNESEDHEEK